MIIVYSTDFIAENQGLGVRTATALIIAFGLGGILGVAVGAFVGQWVYRKR